jgi:hypothetical protein
MRAIKYIIIAVPIALCTLIAILSGLIESAFAFLGHAAYRVQCTLIDWAQTTRRG